MISLVTSNWQVANQQYLMATIGVVRAEANYHLASQSIDNEQPKEIDDVLTEARQKAQTVLAGLPGPAALDTLVTGLGLSAFERDVLLLCAGVELDTAFGEWLRSISGGSTSGLPTFGLALALLPTAYWSALSPTAPVRYWQLIEVGTGPLLTQSPLRIDEQILHYLTGTAQLDERLRDLVEPITTRDTDLADSQRGLAGHILTRYAEDPSLLVRLDGPDEVDKIAMATRVSAGSGQYLFTLSAPSLPTDGLTLNKVIRLWNREAALNDYALYVNTADLDPADRSRTQAVTRFLDGVQGLTFISGSTGTSTLRRAATTVSIQKPTPAEQLHQWRQTLGDAWPEPDLLWPLAAQFDLSLPTIRSVGAEVLHQPAQADLTRQLWQACCAQTRPRLDGLARRIEPVATWDDIVLPDQQTQTLHEVVMQVRQRNRVYGDWGFGATGARGLGISVLFAGESGTGKTMAAEVLANALHLDLYRIDLSQVVNKYIGETEKNLRRIFDAAESGGAILLFDEADALFGKRSDVKDSHDRYSNIEVSYLLQRMEAYRGLAILTTNMRAALDKAFLRRLRFVVPFPYPDAPLRADIWRRVFPANTPTHDLDFEKLARLNIPGGNIRNIALNAAFLAAHDGQAVQMHHLARAARSEYSKLERPMSQTEINGW